MEIVRVHFKIYSFCLLKVYGVISVGMQKSRGKTNRLYSRNCKRMCRVNFCFNAVVY